MSGIYLMNAEAVTIFREYAPSDFWISEAPAQLANGTTEPCVYWAFHTRIVDALDIERSSLRWMRHDVDGEVRYRCADIGKPVFFDQNKLGDAHLFQDVSSPGLRYVSRALLDRLDDARVYRPDRLL